MNIELEAKRLKMLQNTRNWRKTKRGVVTNIYSKLIHRNLVTFSLIELHSFSECKKFDRIFKEWEKSKYKKEFKPSIDRISNKGIYEINNIQWLTWKENRYKQTMERRNRKGSVMQMFNGQIVKIFKSQRQAVKETGLSQSNISNVLNGKRKECGGFNWKYTE